MNIHLRRGLRIARAKKTDRFALGQDHPFLIENPGVPGKVSREDIFRALAADDAG
ncbi:hypothetical protein [Desulfatiglans anilini]|uniref:hypothetical protein n=1 Tax=Desulfatiglans anilini TaxID=90728 RepID=UPI0003FA213F|nr:hypothetical protein [Desulfatiglans anilini]